LFPGLGIMAVIDEHIHPFTELGIFPVEAKPDNMVKQTQLGRFVLRFSPSSLYRRCTPLCLSFPPCRLSRIKIRQNLVVDPYMGYFVRPFPDHGAVPGFGAVVPTGSGEIAPPYMLLIIVGP